MKPILIVIDNTVSVLSEKTTEAVQKYWGQKQFEMTEQGIEDSVIKSSYNAFLNVLNNYWVLNQKDGFIADLPEELEKPSVKEFAFEYVDGTPTCLFVSKISSEDAPYLFEKVIASEADDYDPNDNSDDYHLSGFENQSPE